MRCKNCGWPNRQDEKVCTKCGAPLEPVDGESQQFQSHSNQTVMEGEIFSVNLESPNSCPKCGYPLRAGMAICPNCNASFSTSNIANHSVPQTPNQVRRPTIIGGANIHGTINVWTDGDIGLIPSFTLSPVRRSGEKKELADIEFEGDSTSLNRDNTDPGNLSITSKEQAHIYRNGDKWFIEDKSEQKTTFVQASCPREVHDGDIILLGNRLFVFHE